MYEVSRVHSHDKNTDENFEQTVISEAERLKPIIAERLLLEHISDNGMTDAFRIYCRAFGESAAREVRMIIFKPLGDRDAEDYFLIRRTFNDLIGQERVLLNAAVKNFVLIITTLLTKSAVTDVIDKLRAMVKACRKLNIMAVYSETAQLGNIPSIYRRISDYMSYSFYSEENNTIYEKDISVNNSEIVINPQYSAIEHAVRSGGCDKVRALLASFFRTLRTAMPSPAVAKVYCLELYVSIIRCCGVEKIDEYMKGIVYVQEAKSLTDIQEFITENGLEIAANNMPESERVYSSLVNETIRLINENLENEHLSLRWLAGTILYTNVDYLGKLFKKETGRNFSHYVMEKRMELAKELILEGSMERIYEVAETVGYGSNSQYFSQVFKKYTGISPLEYKEFAKLTRSQRNL